jgi:hypothetical protein
MSLLTIPGANVTALLAAWFPPYQPPAGPVAPAAFVSCVGLAAGAGYYGASMTVAGCNLLVSGQTYTLDPRGSFVFHQSPNPFSPNGISSWFESVSGK